VSDRDQDRRKDDRFREKAQVAVTVLSAPEAPDLVDRTFFCPTADLSLHGMRLSVHVSVPVGAVIQLRVAFVNPLRAFTHDGRVVWGRKDETGRHPFALGVEFPQLPPAEADAWRDMIERKLTIQPLVKMDGESESR